jgi:rhodanese-related sulfurtransferase
MQSKVKGGLSIQPSFASGHQIMQPTRQLKKKSETFLGPTSILVAVLALTVSLAWLSAWAGQPLSQGQVLHLDARGLDILLLSDPNLLLVDVSTPDELAGPLGKIPQSRNVTMQELKRNPEQFPRDKTLVLICRSGHRSLEAAGLLADHGYVVYSVDGGMLAWRKLHPQKTLPAEGTPPKEPPAPSQTPEMRKPSPREDGDGRPPEKNFFENNMGC